ncbi:DUF481 domain-containing protein [Pontibacter sp. 172403-2]|uniref:DUF481 domain-containing protein n=1 Tax=Pontibacter rufus TaxID=2791028 RepID=UPI0018AFE407|nr:DUF481 domain-containing protein [Pontibacter sp. 172403-2]MBF9255099.1 DUF481 domain-containing protein [Pontibacter sp. 172403-2]
MRKTACLSLLILPALILFLTGKPAFARQAPAGILPQADALLHIHADSLSKTSFILLDSLSYRLFGDGNFTRGNVNRSLMVLRAEVTLAGPVLTIATNPRFSYGKQNGVLAERDTYVDLFIDVFKKRKTYVFGLATVEISHLRGIDLRQLAGAGVGYRLLQTERNMLTLTDAIIHESTNFAERPTLVTQRNSFRVKGSHKFLDDRIRFAHVTFVQPSLRDFSNLRWNTLLSLEMPLTSWVSIRTSFANTYESEVEATRRHNDSQITFGVALGRQP